MMWRRITALLYAACALGAFSAAPSLVNPQMVVGQFQFTLNGVSNTAYIVEASTNLQTWFPIATNRETSASRQIQSPTFGPRAVYRAAVGRPLFNFAIIARDRIDLNGNNILVDSFDSQDPNLSTAGQYDVVKRSDAGDVASNSGTTNSINVGNASIYGQVFVGVDGRAVIGPNGAVGSKAWHTSGQVGIQPGWFRNDLQLHLRDVPPPSAAGYYTPSAGGGWKYLLDMDAGYQVPTLRLNTGEKMLVKSNATLVVTSQFTLAGGLIEIAPGANFHLVVGGSNTTISGTVSNRNAASSFIYYGLPGNTNIALSLTSPFSGCIYAPNADLTLGSTHYHGAIVARNVSLSGSLQFHYDQALKNGPFTW